MPGPWRLVEPSGTHGGMFDFNLRRDARPLATDILAAGARLVQDFNLRRDARPLATNILKFALLFQVVFQSQTRSQAPGDMRALISAGNRSRISISDEKPGPWRPLVSANPKS